MRRRNGFGVNRQAYAGLVDETVGARIRTWRRRRNGMSQQVLAELAGVSQGYVSQIETGRRPLERRSTQVAIAGALNISVAQLLGLPSERVDPVLDRAMAPVPAIRQVAIELSAGERRVPRNDRDVLVARARQVTHLRCTADHAALMPLLPDLMLDIAGHGLGLTPQLIEVVDAGVYALKAVGHADLARALVEVAIPAAREFDQPQWIGQALYTWVQSFPPETAPLGARIAGQAADELQGVPGLEAQQMYGHLRLMSAMDAAVSMRADEARDLLTEAQQLAAALGEPERIGPLAAGFNGNWFGPTNVAFWRMAIAAELGDLGDALAVQERVELSAMPAPARLVYYWTDLARALIAGGRDRDALHALAKAERSAPQHFRFNPAVRDLVHALITRAKRRAVAGELTGLARTLGLDPL